MSSLEVTQFVSHGVPKHPYEKVAKQVLPSWDISLVFAGRTRATTLNKQLRRKSYAPNVLSYTVGKKSGEIIICPPVAKTQAHSYDMSQSEFILYLFIHGLLHLKGHAHGSTMEKRERATLARFMR
jgi:rRNA maturation RNase YbeY